MKIPKKLLVLIIGFTAFTSTAQKADSVIVIYNKQKTIIPLPAFGNQTSVSYADSNKVIEIGVWLRKPGEASPFSQFLANGLTVAKPKNTSKWCSQVEGGYIIGFTKSDGKVISTYYVNNALVTSKKHITMNNREGYQLRLSLHETERYYNKNHSFISGFKLGFAQSLLQANNSIRLSDSTGNLINSFDNNYKFRINSFQFLYQFGFSYHFTTGKLPARINFGNCLGFSHTRAGDKNESPPSHNSYLYTTLLQPYIGLEIRKIGVLFSADLNMPNNHYYILYNDLGHSISLSVMYRIF
jgi:hypothetical protein